jgi:hypothetical protein
MPEIRLGKITAPDFVAGFETDGRVIKAAPIIKYMIGWPDQRVRDYVSGKGWKVTRVTTRLEKAEREPLVQAVIKAFHGATIVDVRDPKDSLLGTG